MSHRTTKQPKKAQVDVGEDQVDIIATATTKRNSSSAAGAACGRKKNPAAQKQQGSSSSSSSSSNKKKKNASSSSSGSSSCGQEPPFALYANDTQTRPSFTEGWESVVKLLRGRKNIAVLAGAGISVSCGIPDFRSKGSGLYSMLDTEELGLSCPEELFDVHFFREDPRPFYKFARKLYFPLENEGIQEQPERVLPSDAHKLLALLEQNKMLLRVYSQNIDGLEEDAGVSAKKICYAHGSLQWATCCKCKRKVSSKEIESDILNGSVAFCQAPIAAATVTAAATREPSARNRKRPRSLTESVCAGRHLDGNNVCGGVMKPGITFFGEALQNNVKSKLEADRDKVDALIVIGTSLSVAPISKVIGYLPPDIPRVLINRTIVHPPDHCDQRQGDSDEEEQEKDFREDYVFDAYLLGFCDDVTRALGKVLFSESGSTSKGDSEVEGQLLTDLLQGADEDSSFSPEDWTNIEVPTDRVFLFPGAQPPSGNAEEVAYREVAQCDGCSKRIQGTIQKCVTCFDYDLCQKCYPRLSKTHFDGTHVFTVEQSN